MRISDWSSDVCASYLDDGVGRHQLEAGLDEQLLGEGIAHLHGRALLLRVVGELCRGHGGAVDAVAPGLGADVDHGFSNAGGGRIEDAVGRRDADGHGVDQDVAVRSEEHTSELQSLMRISYAVFCLKKKQHTNTKNNIHS